MAATKVTVVDAGVQTTVQDIDGRRGYWDVGVPPSGAFDEFTFALVNAAVGNPDTAGGLECVVRGPVLAFDTDTLVCVGGGLTDASVDGWPLSPGEVRRVRAGAVLDVGPVDGPGMRGYVAVQGGIDVPRVLGSRATFILGGFGGVEGRPVLDGDVLPLGRRENLAAPVEVVDLLPALGGEWELRVIAGPHGAPEHLTVEGVRELFATSWRVDHRADRTGVRLVGPMPGWARTDGGEAGLHPSNVHDSAYPVGGIMLSGDTPVIVGKDGPSLGGFVVPAGVIGADLWKLGQLRPGDTVQLVPVAPDDAEAAMRERRALLDLVRGLGDRKPCAQITPVQGGAEGPAEGPAGDGRTAPERITWDRPAQLAERPAAGHHPAYSIRRSGDRHLLLEAGPSSLELTVRVWIHLLAEALRADRPDGVAEIVEGVRSVLVKVDDAVLRLPDLARHLVGLAADLADPATVVLDVREVTMPMAFDHPEAHEAMRRYQSVNPTAPWNPDNVEFIRRVNDLPQRDDVFGVVTEATYLVVGLGDVYLGAPVAVPIDPRHRLVTTKYNPARTWTPQNAVGIGGIYLCIYGMEGPGGYQLVGRTVPVWRLIAEDPGRDPKPWLLRQFDRIRFVPVTAEELALQRAEIKAGVRDLDIRPATFSVAEVAALEEGAADEIALVRAHRRAAFDAERQRWVS
ncbi:5-oxoprolinase/urea amidolyase family protein [Nocardioides cavernaquae]|uniref:5-oxoprolinase/urea amidolyase family protein n=1 Tax=Nocardioides cavernaquae TaxID=2321396 RepID=A0A3A5HCM6_9ACTN|nr:5-oxoprolinase/urea amidolyase family protein [Nocardioides cavernaquae]RJS47851.1 5-oxoprolinase/urea amidolyase family protein [Nocardioides cavernaquae]